MEQAQIDGLSQRAELLTVVGTIVAMVLSSACVVVVCAAANEASGMAAAKVIHAVPAASAVGDYGAPTDVAGVPVRVAPR